MLNSQLQHLWDEYAKSERVRVRSESLKKLDAFVEAALHSDLRQIEDWARDLVAKSSEDTEETPIRMPLFRAVLFPILLSGYQRSDVESIWLLSRLSQLLYNAPDCAALLPESDRTEYGLLLKLHRLSPSPPKAGSRLLEILYARYEYALHELPAGVLYGHDGATPDQCVEMLEELAFFEEIAQSEPKVAYAELITKSRYHITAYREYLMTRNSEDTYERYISNRNA